MAAIHSEEMWQSEIRWTEEFGLKQDPKLLPASRYPVLSGYQVVKYWQW
jgi:hypothetical protein